MLKGSVYLIKDIYANYEGFNKRDYYVAKNNEERWGKLRRIYFKLLLT